MVDSSAIVSMLLDSESPVTHLRTFLFREGIVDSEEEYRSLLREVTIRLARKQVASSTHRDEEVMHAIKALDDLNDTINLFSERIADWYAPHKDSDSISNTISESDLRQIPEQDNLPCAMRMLAQNLIDLHKSRDALIRHIKDEIARVAPNLTNLAGALLAARLLSIAGGLNRLCIMPASRVQILGANRAMFRHLRGASPPKHGAIFQHPHIHASPHRMRGRIARAFASKLVIAARIDYYSGKVSEGLAQDLTDRIESIKRKMRKGK